MNYLQRNSNYVDRKRSARRKVMIISLIFLFIAIIMITPPLRQTFFFITKPIWKLENSILGSNFTEYFKTKQTLINEKILAEQALFTAGNAVALNSTLQTENETLKNILGRQDIKKQAILAAVLVKPPQSPYDTLIVDIGSDKGIKIGNQVMANGDVYIGEVSVVMANTAKIVLYSTPGKKIPVVFGTSSISAEAEGIGGGNFNIYLPREVEVMVDDVINIPSITPNVFGIVEQVNYKDQDSFQTILFKSPVNISELSFVEIVL